MLQKRVFIRVTICFIQDVSPPFVSPIVVSPYSSPLFVSPQYLARFGATPFTRYRLNVWSGRVLWFCVEWCVCSGLDMIWVGDVVCVIYPEIECYFIEVT